MRTKLQRTCIAGAVAAFVAFPAAAQDGQAEQPADTLPWTESTPEQTSPGTDPGLAAPEAEPGLAAPQTEPSLAAPDAMSIDNPLYAHTPEELRRVEVVDPAGERVGRVKTVVLGPDRESASVVISSGGFLGLGAKEIIVSLDELEIADDRLQVRASKESLESRGDYIPEQYVEMDPERPISEFSAFEPITD